MENNKLAVSFEQYKALINTNVDDATADLISSMSTSGASRVVDVERLAFGSTTIGKNNTKIYKQTGARGANFLWHDAGSEDKDPTFVGPFNPVAVRGFIIKAKDGFILYASDEQKAAAGADAKLGPICTTSSCTVGNVKFNGQNSSPFPLSSWQSTSKTSRKPNLEIVNLDLQGSRGESCADCIMKGNNIEGTVEGRENKCQPTTGVLFAITHVAKASTKNAEGIEWFPVTELHDDNMEPVYKGPVIVNIDTTRSVNGSSGYNSIYIINVGASELATASTGGRKYIPDDVKLFYSYFKELRSNNFVKPAPKGTGIPEHPRLPIIIPVQTEIYLPEPQSACGYANVCPAYRTNGSAETDPQIFSDWLQCLQSYVETYENYVTANNLVDDSYSDVSNVKYLTHESQSTSSSQLNIDVYRADLGDNVA